MKNNSSHVGEKGLYTFTVLVVTFETFETFFWWLNQFAGVLVALLKLELCDHGCHVFNFGRLFY